MRAALLKEPKRIELGEMPEQKPEADQVRVKVKAVTICGSDHHIWLGEFGDRIHYPHVLGHEFSGVIDSVGTNVERVKVGDEVTVDPLVHCGVCTACIEGHTSACEKLGLLGVDYPGGQAEYAVCSEKSVYRLPENVSLEHGAMAEVYSVACHAMRRGGFEPADSVAVFGAGKLGLCIIDVLRAAGVGEVYAVDIDPFRLETARKLGAIPVNGMETEPVDFLRRATGGRGADVCIEAVGHAREVPGRPHPLAEAAASVRNAGRMVVLGQGKESVPIPVRDLVWKEVNIRMSRVTRGEFPRALKLMSAGLLHPDMLITHRGRLAQAGEFFERIDAAEEGMVKVQLEIGDE